MVVRLRPVAAGRARRPAHRAGAADRARPEVYGLLAPADVLAQLAHVDRLREWLLAGVPGGVWRRMLAARLDRVHRLVAAGLLPELLLADLERAAGTAAARYPDDARPARGYLPVDADRAMADAERFAAAPPAAEPERLLRLASPSRLWQLVEAGVSVQIHGWRAGTWGHGQWEISLARDDVAEATSSPWTPDLRGVRQDRVLAGLLPVLSVPPGSGDR